MMETFLKTIKRKNKTVVAKYLALRIENQNKRKCMITFVAEDEKYSTLKAYKTAFINKIKSILKRKEFEGLKLAYFAVVEFGKDHHKNFHPHVHIQCFCESLEPVHEAYKFVQDKFKECEVDFMEAINENLSFSYVIKDFLAQNFSHELEQMKYTAYK